MEEEEDDEEEGLKRGRRRGGKKGRRRGGKKGRMRGVKRRRGIQKLTNLIGDRSWKSRVDSGVPKMDLRGSP